MDLISQITSNDLFVRLCKALFSSEYRDFESVDDSGGDAGNDGYSASEKTLFQLYCPEKPQKVTDAAYKKKIKDDLDKAKKLIDSGKYKIENWIFVTPSDLRENVHTYIREEAKARGFIGSAWSNQKLVELFAKHSHLRSQFPDLIQPDIENLIKDEVITRLDTKEELEKKYKTKIEQAFKKRIDEARDVLNSGKQETAKKEYERIIADLEAETDTIDRYLFFRAYNNLGSAELDSHNYDKAAELFEKAYSNASEDPKALTNFALSKGLKNNPEEGLKIIDEVLKNHSNDEHAISIKGSLLKMANKQEELISFLKEKGKIALAHFYEGVYLLDKKDYESAMNSFEKGYQLDSKNITSLLYAVQCVMIGSQEFVKENPFPKHKAPKEITQKFERAISWLKIAIANLEKTENTKDLEMAYTNLSGCYIPLEEYEDAIGAAQEAIIIDPMSAMAYFNRGIAELKLNRFKESLESLTKFKDLGGEMPDIDIHIALCALETGDLDKAEKIIDSKLDNSMSLDLAVAELAIELYSRRLNGSRLNSLLKRLEDEFPMDSSAIRIRVKYLRRIGEEGAEDLLKKAIQNAKSDSEKILSELDMALLLQDKKDYLRASVIYEKHIDPHEQNPANRRYADCLYNLSEYGKLLKWVEVLDPSVRNDPYIKELEAYANLIQNNLEKASTLFKELYEKAPNYLKYLTYYGMCRVRLGKESEAKQAYDMIKNRITNPADLVMLAGGYEFMGERNLAVELTYKALIADEHNPKAHLAYIFTFLKREQAEGSEFDDKYVKAFQKSIGEFNTRFPENTELKGFEVKDNDISEILKVADQMAGVADTASDLYKESKIPLAYISKFTGKKSFDIWAAFIEMPEVGIKISFGSPEEVKEDNATAQDQNNQSIVTDIYPLFLLGRLNRFDLLEKNFSKIYVHQSVLDDLNEKIDHDKISVEKGISTFGKVEGQYRLMEIPAEHVKKTITLLEKIKDFITKNPQCEIKGLISSSSPIEAEFIDSLDDASKNSVLLAQELGIPLYCDDRILRAVLRNSCNVKSFATLALIESSEKQKKITTEDKFNLQKELIDLNYDFISVNGGFIFENLKKGNYEVEKIQKIIVTISRKETNTESLGIVFSDLVLLIMGDQNIDSSKKILIMKEVLSQVKQNHDITKIEEMVFTNLQKKIKPEKHADLKIIITGFFKI